MSQSKILKPFGPLILHEIISEDFLKFLNEESIQILHGGEDVGWDLAGNIETQLQGALDPKKFMDGIYPYIFNYVQACHDRKGDKLKSISFNCGDGPWFNFQRKNEFNPVHMHGGQLSCVVMIDVPKVIATEAEKFKDKSNMPCAGQLEFVDGPSGYMYTGSYKVVPKTGDIFVFPAQLKHTVYPFKSDVTRLTMSCNIFDITISAYYEAVANVIV
tara:strand:- start:52 stop:699 length:648 start_codon:yes stop_codon:yes gene_type:complete